jgi:hypothetical protein
VTDTHPVEYVVIFGYPSFLKKYFAVIFVEANFLQGIPIFVASVAIGDYIPHVILRREVPVVE